MDNKNKETKVKKYHECPEKPHPVTGNVSCDNYGYCPHGEVCNIEIK